MKAVRGVEGGVAVDGGAAEQFRAPADRLVCLPPGLDPRDACLVEPAAVAWHALRLAGAGPGQITHRFPIEDAPEALRVAADRAAGWIRVVVEPA